MRKFISIAIASLLTLSCTQAEDDASSPESSPSSDAGDTENSGTAPPDHLEGTAWQAVAEDGARYVTYLDEGGTYRDLRNGDPFQDGGWTYTESETARHLCFTPNDEDGVETCWEPGRQKDDTLIMTGTDGRRVELRSVAYEAPAGEDAEGG